MKEFISSQSKVTISESGKVLKRRKTEAIKPKPITDMFRLSKISPLLSIEYKINTTLRRMLSGILVSSLFGSEDATQYHRDVDYIKRGKHDSAFTLSQVHCEVIHNDDNDNNSEELDAQYEKNINENTNDVDDTVDDESNANFPNADDTLIEINNLLPSDDLVHQKIKRNDPFLGQYDIYEMASKCKRYAKLIHSNA